MFEWNGKGEDPTKYMMGREHEYLDKIAKTKVELKGALHKRHLKKKYNTLLDIVAKCLMSTESLEQVSRPKIRLMAAIEDSPKVEFNWLKFFHC